MATAKIGYSKRRERKAGIALCLSGGGYRAALYHAGALIRLNELGVLSKIKAISSVSGGSLINGILGMKWSGLKWEEGIATNLWEMVVKALVDATSKDIRTAPLLTDRVLGYKNWVKLMSEDFSATDLLQLQYEKILFGEVRIADLPANPNFIFCATNVQTGVSWEFSAQGIGDYQIGYAKADVMRVSQAVAASSAFPLAFPPLVLKFPPKAFSGGKIAAKETEFRERVLLTDGGVYDNLGLEPVWKEFSNVIVSDGGKPFFVNEDQHTAMVNRLRRCQDIVGNQALALRKRMLLTEFAKEGKGGAYFGLRSHHKNYKLSGSVGYEPDIISKLEQVRTDFNGFSDGEKCCLINHGYTLADSAVRRHMSTDVAPKNLAFQIPYPDYMDSTKALEALETH